MNDMQFSDLTEETQAELEEEAFLQAEENAEYDEFYLQEQERDERAREIAEEAE